MSATYDSRGRIQQFTGPRTDVTQHTNFAYYSDTDSNLARRGQLHTVTDALSHVTKYAGDASPYNTYTLYGEPRSVADPDNVIVDLSYDNLGRLTTHTIKGVTTIQSGWQGPALSMPRGTAGYDIVTRTHVEGHAAALMRQNGVVKATLYINNPSICSQCAKLLPKMLAPSSELDVVLPNGTVIPFTGGRP